MIKSVLFIAMLLITLAYGSFTELEYRNTFTNWMIKNKKHYSNQEFASRYNTFKSNMDFVSEWNTKGDAHRVGLNSMADLTNEEYQRIYLGTKFDASKLISKSVFKSKKVAGSSSDELVDWRAKGAVDHIKNQGQCGGCWSFSTTGSIEGAYEIANGKKVALSEQQLIDCSTSYGNQGCNGGLMTLAMEYVIKTGGLMAESAYPFIGEDGECKFKKNGIVASISSYVNITSGSESDLATEVDNGPVSVAIDASGISFQLYDSGIYYDILCSSTKLDHGVLAVGYGSGTIPATSTWSADISVADSQEADKQSAKQYSDSGDFWIVKNSWGVSWGTEGFIYMSRNRNNNCGIATMASRPIM